MNYCKCATFFPKGNKKILHDFLRGLLATQSRIGQSMHLFPIAFKKFSKSLFIILSDCLEELTIRIMRDFQLAKKCYLYNYNLFPKNSQVTFVKPNEKKVREALAKLACNLSIHLERFLFCVITVSIAQ